MNSNPFQSSHQQTNSYSDDESDLTFYSLNNSSITEIESTINSSVSNETVIISNRNKQQRIY